MKTATKTSKRAAAQDGVFWGGALPSGMEIGSLTVARYRLLEKLVLSREKLTDEDAAAGALFLYAHDPKNVPATPAAFWKRVEAWIGRQHTADVVAFAAIFEADLAALAAVQVRPRGVAPEKKTGGLS